MDYCWSCPDGRHRGGSCPQLHRSGQFLLHTKRAQSQSDLAQVLAAAVEGVKSSRLLEVNEAVAGQSGEEEVPHWGLELEYSSHYGSLDPVEGVAGSIVEHCCSKVY